MATVPSPPAPSSGTAAAPQKPAKPVERRPAHKMQSVTAIVDADTMGGRHTTQGVDHDASPHLHTFRLSDAALPNPYSGSLVLVRPMFRTNPVVSMKIDGSYALVGRVGTFVFALRGTGVMGVVQGEPSVDEIRKRMRRAPETQITPAQMVQEANRLASNDKLFGRMLANDTLIRTRLLPALPGAATLRAELQNANAPFALVPSLFVTTPNAQKEKVPAIPNPVALARAVQVLAIYCAVYGGAASTPEAFSSQFGFDLSSVQARWYRFAGALSAGEGPLPLRA